jgi:hypothetical protein
MAREPRMQHTCDLCTRKGTHFSCPAGCNYDLCSACYEKIFSNAKTKASREWRLQRWERSPHGGSTHGGSTAPHSTGETNYVNRATGESTYERPTASSAGLSVNTSSDTYNGTGVGRTAAAEGDGGQGLPEGWETAVSRSTGETYYVNHATGESTYERPTASSAGLSVNPGGVSSMSFERFDANGSGELGYLEMQNVLQHLHLPADASSVEEILGVFGRRGQQGGMVVTKREFPSLWAHLGQDSLHVDGTSPAYGAQTPRFSYVSTASPAKYLSAVVTKVKRRKERSKSWWKIKRGLSKEEEWEVRSLMLDKEREAMQDAIADDLKKLIKQSSAASEELTRATECVSLQNSGTTQVASGTTQVARDLETRHNVTDKHGANVAVRVLSHGPSSVESAAGEIAAEAHSNIGSNIHHTKTAPERRLGNYGYRNSHSKSGRQTDASTVNIQREENQSREHCRSREYNRVHATESDAADATDNTFTGSVDGHEAPRIRRSSVESVASSAASSVAFSTSRRRAKALHVFSAVDAGDLEFGEGAIICLTKHNPNKSWWRGFLECDISRARGNFPASCTHRLCATD